MSVLVNIQKKRWIQHKKLSVLSNHAIHCAIRKHGIENFSFDIIYQSKDKDYTLEIMEPYFIKQYDSYGQNGYNRSFGGESIYLRTGEHQHSEITKKKLSASGKLAHLNGNMTLAHLNRRKSYKIIKNTGEEIIFTGLKQFCKENGYKPTNICSLLANKVKSHKDIIKVEKI